eukprot:TRINITY_DN54640_c0_g1_i4.p1 TRINITY_DN54640_c0_g1~~TRINITY_DN54640_c0_g1_i4.p1  ORF type:complete len:123 (+),score=25.68 TRINITY_DN54640_c0_g1_i4:102-470(+)
MIRRPPRSTLSSSSAASDVYKRQLLGDVRKTVRKGAVAKDQGERLEVFYDHLRRLHRHASTRFPSDDLAPLEDLLETTRLLVEAKDGLVVPSDFTHVWRSFKALFTRAVSYTHLTLPTKRIV